MQEKKFDPNYFIFAQIIVFCMNVFCHSESKIRLLREDAGMRTLKK